MSLLLKTSKIHHVVKLLPKELILTVNSNAVQSTLNGMATEMLVALHDRDVKDLEIEIIVREGVIKEGD